VFQFSRSATGLLFYQLSSLKPDTKNNANFDAVSSKCDNFDDVQ